MAEQDGLQKNPTDEELEQVLDIQYKSSLKFDVLIKFHPEKWPPCVWCIISFTPSPVPRFIKVWVRLDWNPSGRALHFFRRVRSEERSSHGGGPNSASQDV